MNFSSVNPNLKYKNRIKQKLKLTLQQTNIRFDQGADAVKGAI